MIREACLPYLTSMSVELTVCFNRSTVSSWAITTQMLLDDTTSPSFAFGMATNGHLTPIQCDGLVNTAMQDLDQMTTSHPFLFDLFLMPSSLAHAHDSIGSLQTSGIGYAYPIWCPNLTKVVHKARVSELKTKKLFRLRIRRLRVRILPPVLEAPALPGLFYGLWLG